ncbi:uncharacterized protein LOC132702523 [Cylas formicarius]|uniref:uncharacterized protein LOC132702523 n=1 Tax=Cylas formicarius TaxID=197179 RepID=UPI0029587D66|nr:uncharacterized protein LOC132702523 [Cylas formicarius]
MEIPEIRDLEGLLRHRITGKIIRVDATALSAFGENFGSIMAKVDIVHANGSKEETLHAVAKLIPTLEFIKEIFNTQVTFKNEINWYLEVVPALQEFQKEAGAKMLADYFAELYGARINLSPNSDVVDSDAVILMENLKVEGYTNIDRMEGFDLETTRLILDHLANFHATAIGLKLKRPEVFEKRVKPHLTEWIPPSTDNFKQMIADFLDGAGEASKHKSKFIKCLSKQWRRKINEPWATITHNDFWVNNVMVKHEGHHVTSVKFVDFQVVDYGSVASDLLFFLLGSVQLSVIKYHFQKLLKYYYERFVDTLRDLRVDTRDFTYQSFEKELDSEGGRQVAHVAPMLFVIMGPKNAAPPPPPKEGEPMKFPPFKPPLNYYEKLGFIVDEAVRRKWI